MSDGKPDFPNSGTAVVVGGSGGLGQAICTLLAARGSDVVLTYRNNEAGAAAAAKSVETAGRKAEIHRMALEDSDAVKAVVDDAAARFGGVHTVVYASGPDFRLKYISRVSIEEWRRIIDADVNGFFNLVHASLPHLRDCGQGSMVAVITCGTERYAIRDVLSIAPKAAVETVVKGIAHEEGRFGVRANCVGPGIIESGLGTRMLEQDWSPEAIDYMRNSMPLRRFGQADEVAEAVVFLASAKGSYITGQSIAVDGGYQI